MWRIFWQLLLPLKRSVISLFHKLHNTGFITSDIRSSHRRCSIKKLPWKFHNVYRKKPDSFPSEFLFNKVAGLQLYQKGTPIQVFSSEYCGIFKNTYFGKHLRTVSQFFLQWSLLTAIWNFLRLHFLSILFILENYDRVAFRIPSNVKR